MVDRLFSRLTPRAVLFKVFDYDKSGSINKSEIEKQFRQSVAENGFSIEEAKLQVRCACVG